MPSLSEAPRGSTPANDLAARAFHSAGWGIATSGPDGVTLTTANPAFAKMHGYAVEELIGRSIIEVFAPSARAAFVQNLAIAERLGHLCFESEHVRKDGATFPVRLDLSVVKDAAGTLTGRVVHVQDVTDQIRRTDLRTASMSRDVLDALQEGCQVIGFDWRYLYVNDAVAVQAKRTPEELIGRTMMECFPGIDSTPMFDELRRVMSTRVRAKMANDFQYPDGARVAFDLTFVPVPRGVCILSLDITERRHRLAAIVNDSEDAIVGKRLDGIVTSWNRGAERVYGYSAEEMLGQHIDRLTPAGHEDQVASFSERLRRGERIAHFDAIRRQKSGELIDVWVALSPIKDADGDVVGVSSIARNVTDIKRMQRELGAAKEAAEVLNRELESFSYSVAHDLRAPLRSIDGFSQALLEDYAERLDDEGRRYLNYVRESAQLMAQLIDDMLTLSRVTRQELERIEVDLSALAQKTLAQLASAQPERSVQTVVHEGLRTVGDPRLLAFALKNLLSNAWKFTGKQLAARIEFGADDSGAELTYFVRDNGAGFDMGYASKLFGVFQRMHSAAEFEGTGVGLAIVQRVIRRHSGRVWAESAVGRGATFFFTLGHGGAHADR